MAYTSIRYTAACCLRWSGALCTTVFFIVKTIYANFHSQSLCSFAMKTKETSGNVASIKNERWKKEIPAKDLKHDTRSRCFSCSCIHIVHYFQPLLQYSLLNVKCEMCHINSFGVARCSVHFFFSSVFVIKLMAHKIVLVEN